MIDLSILVCSVHTRYDTFLPKIQKQLFDQYNGLSETDQDRVEILILTDNKQMMLGHKRNKLVELAQGRYIAFVDDDDRVADDYITDLLKATESDADSIVFKAMVSINGEEPKECYYSRDVQRDYNKPDRYMRIPNHICCIKKETSLKSSFPNLQYGEDAGYSKVLLPHLKTEHKIDKVLYYYDYNAETTETQMWRFNKASPRNKKPVVDVIFLSKATDTQTKQMTQKAIDSCINGANGLPVNIIVIEGARANYEKATTYHRREAFNYNAFANYGAKQGVAEWIMVANNDLVFKDGWLHQLIAADNDVVSPHEPRDPRQADITENTTGYTNGKHFSGWCFMIKRSLWKAIDGFDTDVNFWCSDDVVIEQVKAQGVEPMVVKDSIVEHATSATLRKVSPNRYAELTWANVKVFNKKYGKDKFADNPNYQSWLRRNP